MSKPLRVRFSGFLKEPRTGLWAGLSSGKEKEGKEIFLRNLDLGQEEEKGKSSSAISGFGLDGTEPEQSQKAPLTGREEKRWKMEVTKEDWMLGKSEH